MTPYEIVPAAQSDLFDIWAYIAQDSVGLADRVESEFHDLFASLAKMPRQGHTRNDLTKRPVLFFPLYSYLVVYRPEPAPIRIMAVIRGKRNVKRVLRGRL